MSYAAFQLRMEGHSLTVRDVGVSDAANYTCYAINAAGLLAVPLQLQVSSESLDKLTTK